MALLEPQDILVVVAAWFSMDDIPPCEDLCAVHFHTIELHMHGSLVSQPTTRALFPFCTRLLDEAQNEPFSAAALPAQ